MREREAGLDRGGPSSQQSRKQKFDRLEIIDSRDVNTWRDKISRDIWDISNEFLLFERTLRERLNYVSHINRTFVQHGLLQPGGGRHFKDATQVVLTRT